MAIAILSGTTMSAQSAKELAKQQQELNEINLKMLNSKPTKDAKKQEKKLAKEGWCVPAGSKTIAKQITETLEYTASDFQKARESAAVAAIMLEKRNIIPTAGLETLLSVSSDILDYIYFGDEAKRVAILNSALIADKADYPKTAK